MDQDKDIVKVLKWAGIAILITVPLIFLLRKVGIREKDSVEDDEANIFASELRE